MFMAGTSSAGISGARRFSVAAKLLLAAGWPRIFGYTAGSGRA